MQKKHGLPGKKQRSPGQKLIFPLKNCRITQTSIFAKKKVVFGWETVVFALEDRFFIAYYVSSYPYGRSDTQS